MKRKVNVLDVIVRYSLILLFGLGNLFVFYWLFTPATIYLSGFLLNLVSNTIVYNNLLISNSWALEIIPACVAGSAYYLLFILIFSSADIKIFKRILVLSFSFALFFIINILRIAFLATINKTNVFNLAHLLFWYVLSTAFVVGIWFLSVKIFNIKSIPVYTDLKRLIDSIKK